MKTKLLITAILMLSCMAQVTKYGLSSNDYHKLKAASQNGGIADFNSKLKNDPNQKEAFYDAARHTSHPRISP